MSPNRSQELEKGLSVQELINWIESLDNTPEAHQQNIRKFNDAVYDFIQHGDKSHELLLESLNSSTNYWMMWASMWALTEMRVKTAIEPMWTLYERQKNLLGLRFYTLEALSIFKDERVLKPIVDLLNEESGNFLAISLLGNLEDKRGLYYLAILLQEIEAIIWQAVRYYETLSEYSKFEALLPIVKTKLREKELIIDALWKIGGHKSLKLLSTIIAENQIYIQPLSHYNRLKVKAVYAVSRIDSFNMISILKEAQKHSQYGVRNSARKCLIRLQQKRTTGISQ